MRDSAQIVRRLSCQFGAFSTSDGEGSGAERPTMPPYIPRGAAPPTLRVSPIAPEARRFEDVKPPPPPSGGAKTAISGRENLFERHIIAAQEMAATCLIPCPDRHIFILAKHRASARYVPFWGVVRGQVAKLEPCASPDAKQPKARPTAGFLVSTCILGICPPLRQANR